MVFQRGAFYFYLVVLFDLFQVGSSVEIGVVELDNVAAGQAAYVVKLLRQVLGGAFLPLEYFQHQQRGGRFGDSKPVQAVHDVFKRRQGVDDFRVQGSGLHGAMVFVQHGLIVCAVQLLQTDYVLGVYERIVVAFVALYKVVFDRLHVFNITYQHSQSFE